MRSWSRVAHAAWEPAILPLNDARDDGEVGGAGPMRLGGESLPAACHTACSKRPSEASRAVLVRVSASLVSPVLPVRPAPLPVS